MSSRCRTAKQMCRRATGGLEHSAGVNVFQSCGAHIVLNMHFTIVSCAGTQSKVCLCGRQKTCMYLSYHEQIGT